MTKPCIFENHPDCELIKETLDALIKEYRAYDRYAEAAYEIYADSLAQMDEIAAHIAELMVDMVLE